MPLLYKHGVESLPFSLLVSLFFVSLLIPLAYYELDFFSSFRKDSLIKQNLKDFENSVNVLKTSGKGSFLRIKFTVPGNVSVAFDSLNDCIKIDNKTYNFGVDILNDLYLSQGEYELTVFYGRINKTKEFMVSFE